MLPHGLGAELSLRTGPDAFHSTELLFSEIASSVVASCDPAKLDELKTALAEVPGVYAAPVGTVVGARLTVSINDVVVIESSVAELGLVYEQALEQQLDEEVLA